MTKARESERVDGRVERRLDAMRRVQTVALALFKARGLAQVTVEDVAHAAHVGAASVYRNFGTKEGIVLWDEYDPALLAAIVDRLPSQPPLRAIRDAVLDQLGKVYSRDRARLLQRTRLVLSEPSLLAANVAQQERFRTALATALRPGRTQVEADALAAVALGILDAAIREWVRRQGRRSLAAVVRPLFASCVWARPRSTPKPT
jgi:AcrR family transcriptional regulator